MSPLARKMGTNRTRHAAGVCFAVAILLGLLNTHAAAVNVGIDASPPWNGFENVYYRNGSFWTNSYFPPGSAGVIQGIINNSGAAVCAPDIRMDRDFHFDTNAWADASGASAGACNVLSTFYLDSTTVAGAGDTVIFSGMLVTNGLAAPYSNSIVAFIKDFSSNWGFNGMASVNLNTLTNGQAFTIAQSVAATGDHVQWGFEWFGPPARSNTVAGLGFAMLSALPVPPGAAVPWNTYEAEEMTVGGGAVLGPQFLPNLVASESSGRRCVRLSNTLDFVEFTAQAPANSIVARYSVPDTLDGTGADYTLSLYINTNFVQKFTLTSRYSWLYGAYPFNNNPASGSPRNFYDEVRLPGLTIHTGDRVRLQKNADDTAASYVIDLVDLENVAAPLPAPPESLSIVSFGGVADGVTDCTSALQNCINAAQSQARTAWLPAGAYLLTGNIDLPSGTTLQGAGMWHTRLIGSASLYNATPTRRLNLNGRGTNIHLADFSVTGFLNYRKDTEGNDGLGGYYGTGSSISRIWVEHTKAAAWILNSSGLLVDSCRFRNTLADGINLNTGMQGTLVTNCTARGTGDDCFAVWPANGSATFPTGQNVITHCTGIAPFLANGGALYGGAGNRIEDCRFTDMTYGCGILISTTFPVGAPFSGTTVAQHCSLIRCGGYDGGYGWRAAAQLCLDTYSAGISGVLLNELNISNSVSDALSIIGGSGTLSNALAANVRIPNYGLGVNGRHAVWAQSNARGSLTLSNATIVDCRNDSSRFTFNFVNTLPPAPAILDVVAIPTGGVSFTYAANPGFPYHVEALSELGLADWSTLPGSATNPIGTVVSFTNSNISGIHQRFYRVVSP